MKHKDFESKFLDYLEGTLAEEESAKLDAALDADPDLRASFEAYQRVIETERSVAGTNHSLSPNFVVKVMDRIESTEVGFFRRLIMELAVNQRKVMGSMAALATIVVVIAVSNRTPEAFMSPGEFAQQIETVPTQEQTGPVVAKDISSGPVPKAEEKVVRGLPVSPGNRAVSVDVSKETSVEGYARPGSNTDVVVTYEEGGSKVSKVIIENARVLSLDRNDSDKKKGKESSSTLTLDVSPSDALKIKTAKEVGTLSLMQRSMDDAKGAAIPQQPLSKAEMMQMTGSGNKLDRMAESRRADPNAVIGVVRMPDEKRYEITSGGSMRELEAPAPSSPARIARQKIAQPHGAQGSPFDDSYTSSIVPEPQVRANTEQYVGYEENKRTVTSENPLSTFSIDVDTGSYTNARRFLSMGNMPPSDSVRIEEFINYFDYAYPVQHEKPFTVSYEAAPSPLEKDRYLLKLGIKARDAMENKKPWNLVFLLDVSGSMSDSNKLELVKKSLRILVDKMRPEDKIAIVTYAGNAGLTLDSTSVKERERILAAIDSLYAGGSTNGGGGILMAYDVAARSRIDGGINRVVLATDGDFNVGITSRDALIKLIEEKRRSGITLTTLGYGTGNLNDATMEQLANKGNGNYFYIDSIKEARKVLDTDLFGTMEVVAKDVKLQIEFNPQHVAEYRLVGYENRKLRREDFNNDKIDAGEIGTGHTVTAIYELVLAKSELAKNLSTELRYQKAEATAPKGELSSELAFLKIRYKEPEGERSSLLEFPIDSEDVKSDVAKTSNDFRFAAAVSYFGHKLRGSEYAGDYSFKDIASLAQASKGEDKNGYRQEFIELVKNAAATSR